MDKRIKKDLATQDPYYQTYMLICQVRDIILEAREYEMQQYGVTAIQAGVMFYIQIAGGSASQIEIARYLLRKPSSISGILGRMEKSGLAIKTVDPVKRGMTKVTLTEKGKQIYKQSLKRESIHGMFTCLPEEEHSQLKQLLQKLRNHAIGETGKRRQVPFP